MTKKSVVASNAKPGRISCAFAETSVSAMRAQILRIGYCFLNLESRASQPGESTASLDQSHMSKRTRWPVRPGAGPVRGASGTGTLPYQFFRIIKPPWQPCKIFCQLSCMPIFVQLVPRDPSIAHVEFVIVAALANKAGKFLSKNGCHWIYGVLHRLRKPAAGDKGNRAECA